MKRIGNLYEKFGFSESEEHALSRLFGMRRKIARRTELIYQDQEHAKAFLILDGWIYSSKRLSDGGRQILHLLTPGEFAGLRGLFLPTSDRDVETLTDVVVAEISKDQILEALNGSTHMMRMFLWVFAREEAIVAQHLTSLGRRSGLARTVHLLLEVGHKLGQLGHTDPAGFDCPLTQALLADALGITDTHLNRIFRQLREEKLLNFAGGKVEFLNLPALVKMADFDPSYLEPHGWMAEMR